MIFAVNDLFSPQFWLDGSQKTLIYHKIQNTEVMPPLPLKTFQQTLAPLKIRATWSWFSQISKTRHEKLISFDLYLRKTVVFISDFNWFFQNSTVVVIVEPKRPLQLNITLLLINFSAFIFNSLLIPDWAKKRAKMNSFSYHKVYLNKVINSIVNL